MPDASLLTPEVLALVGRESEPVTAVLSAKAVRHAIEVYGGDATRRFAPGDPVPNFAFAALEPDALPVNVPDLLPDSLLVSNEMEFERELRLGEELSLTGRVADISERFGGRFGYSIFVRTETVARDATGAIVARGARVMMQYDPREGGGEDA